MALYYHYIYNLIKKKQIELVYKPSQKIITNNLTKGLGLGKFKDFFNILKLRSTTELHKNIKKKFGVTGVT